MSTSPSVPRRRVRKRILIPVILLGLILAFLLWGYLRGTWAETTEHNPKTAAEGPVIQLYRTPQGDVQVRSSILIDAPAARVWDVLSDYPNHPRFLPYVRSMEVQQKDKKRVYLTGTVHSRLWGDWSFALRVDHKVVPDKEYTASWDEPSASLPVNQGSWTLTALEPNQTLVVAVLQVEAAGYPNFFVRNLLLDREPKVLRGLRDEVTRRQTGS